MVFVCSFCEKNNTENNGYFTKVGLCDNCEKLKLIINLYSMKSVLGSLETIYIRDDDKVSKRADAIKAGANLNVTKK